MANIYLAVKGCGYGKHFFVRRERTADGKRYLYWLGHRTDDNMSSERVQVSREFYDDFRREINRLKERWRAHKKLAADNLKKVRAIQKSKPHCGVAPACTREGSHCFCNCTNCR
jgi:hypothetical protein